MTLAWPWGHAAGTMTRGILEQFWSHCSCFVTSSFAVSMEIWSRDRPDFLSSEEQTVETGKYCKIKLVTQSRSLQDNKKSITDNVHCVFVILISFKCYTVLQNIIVYNKY